MNELVPTPEVKDYMDRVLATKPVSVDDYAKEFGIDTKAVDAELKAESDKEVSTKVKDMMAPPKEGESPKGLEGYTKDYAQGVVQSLAQQAQNAGNAILSVFDWVEDTAAKQGVGTGEMLEGRMNWAQALQRPEDSFETRLARGVTDVAVPIAAGIYTGGIGIAGMAESMAIDFVTSAPAQPRLSNLVMEYAPELKSVSWANEALTYMSAKPDEGELEGRFKAVLEGMGVFGAFAGGVHAIGKADRVVAAGKKAIKSIFGNTPEKEAAKIAAQSALPPVKPVETPVEIPAAERYNTQQMSFFDDVPEVTASPKGDPPKVDARTSSISDAVSEFRKANPDAFDKLYVESMTFDSLDAEAKAILADDKRLNEVLNFKAGDRPPTPAETKAIMYLEESSRQDMIQKLVLAHEGGENADELLAIAQEAVDNFNYNAALKQGTGTSLGQGLNARKTTSDISGMKFSDYSAQLDRKAKADLTAKFLKESKGKASIMDMAAKVSAIEKMEPGLAAKKLKAAQSPTSGIGKLEDVLHSTSVNGLMSGLTSLRNMVSNALVAGNTAAELYGGAFWGFVRETMSTSGKEIDRITLKQANAYVSAMLLAQSEVIEGIYHGKKLAKTKGLMRPVTEIQSDFLLNKYGRGVNKSVINSEHLAGPTLDFFSSMAERVGLSAKRPGQAINILGKVIEYPAKLNGTADTFFGSGHYRAKIMMDAMNMSPDELKAYRTKNVPEADRAKFDAQPYEYIMREPTVAQHEAAVKWAQEKTFAQEMDKSTKPRSLIASTIEGVDDVRFLRSILPFGKTNFNIIDYGINHSPLSFLLGGDNGIVRKWKSGGTERDEAMGRILASSTMIGISAWLADMGVTTGPETRNYKDKQALNESTGWQPNSLHINGKYIDVSWAEPMSSYLKLGATLASIKNFVKEDEYEELATIVAVGFADFMTPNMMVDNYKGVMEVISAAAREDSTVGAVSSTIQNTIASWATMYAPFSGLARRVETAVDPSVKETRPDPNQSWGGQLADRIWNKYKTIYPGFNSDLPNQRNVFGEEIFVPYGVGNDLTENIADFVNPFASNNGENTPLQEFLSTVKKHYTEQMPDQEGTDELTLGWPARTLTEGGVPVKLTPYQYDRFLQYNGGIHPDTKEKIFGYTLRERMEAIREVYEPIMNDKQNPLDKRTYNKLVGEISKELKHFRDMANALIKSEPEFQTQYLKNVEAENGLVNPRFNLGKGED